MAFADTLNRLRAICREQRGHDSFRRVRHDDLAKLLSEFEATDLSHRKHVAQFEPASEDDLETRIASAPKLQFIYKNFRGEVGLRTILMPFVVDMGANEFHAVAQPMIRAIDCDKRAIRTFTLADIRWLDDLFGREGYIFTTKGD